MNQLLEIEFEADGDIAVDIPNRRIPQYSHKVQTLVAKFPASIFKENKTYQVNVNFESPDGNPMITGYATLGECSLLYRSYEFILTEYYTQYLGNLKCAFSVGLVSDDNEDFDSNLTTVDFSLEVVKGVKRQDYSINDPNNNNIMMTYLAKETEDRRNADNGISKKIDDISEELSIHDHDESYSLLSHNHDGTYSPLSHNHDESYSNVNHIHSYTDLSNKPTKLSQFTNDEYFVKQSALAGLGVEGISYLCKGKGLIQGAIVELGTNASILSSITKTFIFSMHGADTPPLAKLNLGIAYMDTSNVWNNVWLDITVLPASILNIVGYSISTETQGVNQVSTLTLAYRLDGGSMLTTSVTCTNPATLSGASKLIGISPSTSEIVDIIQLG